MYQKSGGSDALLGIRSQQPGTISPTAKDNPGKSADGYALYANSTAGNLVHNNGYVSYGTLISYTNGDIISIAVDLDNNKCYWAKNGTWLNSGNPAGNSNGHSITAASSTSTGEYFPCFGDYDANSYVFLTNFGQDGTFAGTKLHKEILMVHTGTFIIPFRQAIKPLAHKTYQNLVLFPQNILMSFCIRVMVGRIEQSQLV